MVYAGELEGKKLSMGVSGRLEHQADDRNLIMWDEETKSLWSQIRGVGLSGPNEGKQLEMLPAVFVGLGTWQRMHPESKVLNLSTVRVENWFYTSKDLAKGSVRANRRTYDLSIGLREGDDVLAVPFAIIHDRGVVKVEVGGIPLAVVWHADESAALVYDLRQGEAKLELSLEDSELVDASSDARWDALTGMNLGHGQDLPRFPYLPSYLEAWLGYYPDCRVLKLD
jgi:hypothetical protein